MTDTTVRISKPVPTRQDGSSLNGFEKCDEWNHFPPSHRGAMESPAQSCGDDSSVHRWFQRWVEDGVFEGLWATLINECEELQGVKREEAWRGQIS